MLDRIKTTKYYLPDNNNFYKFITDHYKDYTIDKKKKTFEQICYPKRYELQIPQQFLSEYINPNTPYEALLVVHKIGAGKTCTAIRIGEVWKLQRKIVFLAPASLLGNLYNELRSECTNTYITNDERTLLKTLQPNTKEYNRIIEESNERIHKYYEIYSYNKFVELYNSGIITLDNKVLIVDEVQNMVSEGGSYYQTLYKAISNAKGKLRVVLLSATPIFDKPTELALTLNLLKLPELLPTGKDFEKKFIQKHTKDSKITYTLKNMDYFKKIIRGKISYYRGAPPYVYPKMNVHIIKCEMKSFQYKSYLTVLNSQMDDMKGNTNMFNKSEIMELPADFLLGVRLISNISFPNLAIGEKGYDSLTSQTVGKLEDLEKYSIKFFNILNKIKQTKGPVFIYSNFKRYGGIESFVKILEIYGYVDYTEHGIGKKRYAVWSGDVTLKMREEIKIIFNKKENTNGGYIKIILGTPSMKEGVSLLRVRQVHLIEPYWNQSRMNQIIGRAVRFCSHKDLEESQRDVDVYIYIAVHSNIPETVDQHIHKLSLKKHKLNSEFEQVLKESAIDCELFKYGNMDTGYDYKCLV